MMILRIFTPFTFLHTQTLTHDIKYSSLKKFFCYHKKILVCSLLYTIVIIPPQTSSFSVCMAVYIYIHINSQFSFLWITLWNIHNNKKKRHWNDMMREEWTRGSKCEEDKLCKLIRLERVGTHFLVGDCYANFIRFWT